MTFITSHIASKILMVRPSSFGFNADTAPSNAFQKKPRLKPNEIRRRAVAEFDAMVEGLRQLGIKVLIDDSSEDHPPDSVFPNNWFSTHSDGTLCLYPMESEQLRRGERNKRTIETIRTATNTLVTKDLTNFERDGKYLEGTGSLVLDHKNQIAYACLSSRTDESLVDYWAREMNFEAVKFRAIDEGGVPIYHTNVMMCVGDTFAIVCLESVGNEEERMDLIARLQGTGKEIIDISFEQMRNFAGNMLLLQTDKSEKILVMSSRAEASLERQQKAMIQNYAEIAAFDIRTIEDVGGGSVRCMIAEIFEPRT